MSGSLPNVEAAAYYVIAEAIANVGKYAHASRTTVSISRSNGAATVSVTDDGVGGADPAGGSGLRGLAAWVPRRSTAACTSRARREAALASERRSRPE